MQKYYYLKNETEFKIIRALIEELYAEKKIVLLTIRIMDQMTNINCGQIILESENTAKENSIKSELFYDGKKKFSKGTRTTLYN
jgi:hypothetical protein